MQIEEDSVVMSLNEYRELQYQIQHAGYLPEITHVDSGDDTHNFHVENISESDVMRFLVEVFEVKCLLGTENTEDVEFKQHREVVDAALDTLQIYGLGYNLTALDGAWSDITIDHLNSAVNVVANHMIHDVNDPCHVRHGYDLLKVKRVLEFIKREVIATHPDQFVASEV